MFWNDSNNRTNVLWMICKYVSAVKHVLTGNGSRRQLDSFENPEALPEARRWITPIVCTQSGRKAGLRFHCLLGVPTHQRKDIVFRFLNHLVIRMECRKPVYDLMDSWQRHNM